MGADKEVKAPADGYTLLMGHIATLAVNPSIYPNLSYDPVKSFAPVAWVARVPNQLLVHPSVKATTAELIALARANPGKISFGSGGNGSAAHIVTEYLKLKTQTQLVHVPHRGTAPAVTDVVAGQIQMVLTGAPADIPFVKSGQLRAIAVASVNRLEALPDLPTRAESGLKELAGFEADQWYGVVAPAGTPATIIAKLNAQINASLASAELKARLQSQGAVARPTTPEAFAPLIAREIERWRPVVKMGNIQAN